MLIRHPLHTAGQLISATAAAWFLGGLSIPVAQPILQAVALRPAHFGQLSLVLPIAALCWTLREPLGDLSETAGRNLRPALGWHIFAIGLATGLLALGLSLPEGKPLLYLFAAAMILGLTLTSTALCGARWGWILPSIALFIEIFPVPLLPGSLWAWAWYDFSPVERILLSASGLALGAALLLWRQGRPLLAGDSAQDRLHQAAEH